MIPLIDIEPFLHGSKADKAHTAKSARRRLSREFGWLVVAGHGVPKSLIDEMHAVSRGFFSRPHWEKMKHKMPSDRYRGYTPPGTESLAYSLDEERPPDLKEAYSMGPVDAAYDEYHYGAAGARYFAPNIWPDKPADMPRVWKAYYREMTRLSADIMADFRRGARHARGLLSGQDRRAHHQLQRHLLSVAAGFAAAGAASRRRPYRLRQPHAGALRHRRGRAAD